MIARSARRRISDYHSRSSRSASRCIENLIFAAEFYEIALRLDLRKALEGGANGLGHALTGEFLCFSEVLGPHCDFATLAHGMRIPLG